MRIRCPENEDHDRFSAHMQGEAWVDYDEEGNILDIDDFNPDGDPSRLICISCGAKAAVDD